MNDEVKSRFADELASEWMGGWTLEFCVHNSPYQSSAEQRQSLSPPLPPSLQLT